VHPTQIFGYTGENPSKRMTPQAEAVWKRTLVVIGIFCLLSLFLDFVRFALRPYRPPPPRQAGAYNSFRICAPESKALEDHRNDATRNTLSLPLEEGCFGPLIGIPNAWHNFVFQPDGDQDSSWWFAIWIVGESRARGPFGPNTSPNIDIHRQFFRLQGHGRILLYSNDVVPSAPPTS